MAKVQSYCGILCSKCGYRQKVNCPGCVACKGKVFHGNCRVAMCCLEHNLKHCGQCKSFPCDLLNTFAYDPEHGDNGKRIEQLKKWNKSKS
jgi:hypothetical protein